jgi:hypothetical protein
MLVHDLPVTREDPEKQACARNRVLASEFSGAQRLPASRPDVPFDVVNSLRWIAGEHRSDLFYAAPDAAVIPQNGVGSDQVTQILGVAFLLCVDVCLEKGRELPACFLRRVDRDRLPDLDRSQSHVAEAFEILVAGRIIGMIDPPRGRRVQPTSTAIGMDEQFLPRRQRLELLAG